MPRNRGQSAVTAAGAYLALSVLLSRRSSVIFRSRHDFAIVGTQIVMARILFYKELNEMSTADFYTEKKKRRTQASKELFEIERVIAKRGQTGKVSDRCL